MPQQVPAPFYTFGTKSDGSLKHTYPPNFNLVPLGHFNWKWNSTRAKYHTYEKELLAGVLTIATQRRMVGTLPMVWFCDQEGVKTFIDKEPLALPRGRPTGEEGTPRAQHKGLVRSCTFLPAVLLWLGIWVP